MSVRILHCKWQILSSDWLKHIKKIYFHTWFESARAFVSGLVGSLCSSNVIRTQVSLSLVSSLLCVGLSLRGSSHMEARRSLASQNFFYFFNFKIFNSYMHSQTRIFISLSSAAPLGREFLFPNNSGESSGIGFNWTGFFMCPSVTQALWLGRHMDYANLSLRGGTGSIQPSQTGIGGGIVPQRKIWVLLLKWLGMMLGSQDKNFHYIFVTESLLNSGHKHLLWLMLLF